MWAAALAATSPPPVKQTTWRHLQQRGYNYTFAEYTQEFGKAYSTAEYAKRQQAFADALAVIRAHNEDPSIAWKMGLSDHTALFDHEWTRLRGNRRLRPTGMAPASVLEGDMVMRERRSPQASAPEPPPLPPALDWRKRGMVTPVKNQEACGSCWAFSAVETLESSLAVAGGPLLELSPQQLLACTPNPQHCGGEGGCEGATQALAFNYTRRVSAASGGIKLSSAYGYKPEQDELCNPRLKEDSPLLGIQDFVVLPTNDYGALMRALARHGPIAISVDASWGHYEEGVFGAGAKKVCNESIIDHAVQLVGYGEEQGELYWIVRNSWGANWGEQGYIRIKRHGEGREPCAIDRQPEWGYGCDNGPPEVEVCGECGLLSSSSYALGPYRRWPAYKADGVPVGESFCSTPACRAAREAAASLTAAGSAVSSDT